LANVKTERKENRSGRKVDRREKQSATPGAIEWAVGAVSAVVVLAMISFLLYQAWSTREGAPSLIVNVDRIRATDGVHHVEFRVENQGDATAAEVLIQGRLRDGDRLIEEREVTFDYVPGGSEGRAALIFTNDPAGYDLELIPSGYREP